MKLSVEYVAGEERDGFYVQPMMKRAWAAQLEVLKEIDRLCRRHHIRYFAQWGTLLGAVRHHGFIPWDDDMDIAMLRGDYERFRYYARTELPKGWWVAKIEPTLIRVVNGSTLLLDQEFLDRFHGCPYIMGIDIFSMDYLPKDKEEEEVLAGLFEAVAGLHRHWDSWEEICEKEGAVGEDKWEKLEEIEVLTGHRFDRQGSVKEQLCDLGDHIAAMYWDTESDEVTYVPRLFEQPEYRIPRFCFDRLLEVPFEDTTMPIPEDYDLLLRLKFGDDYMTPVRAKANHDYPFFKDDIENLRKLFEEWGEEMPEFFDMAAVDEWDC